MKNPTSPTFRQPRLTSRNWSPKSASSASVPATIPAASAQDSPVEFRPRSESLDAKHVSTEELASLPNTPQHSDPSHVADLYETYSAGLARPLPGGLPPELPREWSGTRESKTAQPEPPATHSMQQVLGPEQQTAGANKAWSAVNEGADSAASNPTTMPTANRVQRVSPEQAADIRDAVRGFYKSATTNIEFGDVSGPGGTARPDSHNALLAASLVSKVREKAHRHGARATDFFFEMAAQLHRRGREQGGSFAPLDLVMPFLLPHVGAQWQQVFSHDRTSVEPWLDPHAVMPLVDCEPAPAHGAGPAGPGTLRGAAGPARPLVVPTDLANAMNTFVFAFRVLDETGNERAAKALVRKVSRADPALPRSSLFDAVGIQLLEACERMRDMKPFHCFTSQLPEEHQIRLQQFQRAMAFARQIESSAVVTTDKQWAQFQLRVKGVASVIGKLPGQTRMMAAEVANQGLEEAAEKNPARAGAIKALKFAPDALQAK